MADTTFIYTLSDPETGLVRYVGKTSHPKHRLRTHISKSINKNNHKECWIMSLIERERKPSMAIIDEVPIECWEFWEKHYIKLYKSIGAKLTNSTDGGDKGIMFTTEARKRMSQGQKKRKITPRGWKLSDEQRHAMSVSRKGRIPWNKGKKLSENHIIRLSESHKGQPPWNKGIKILTPAIIKPEDLKRRSEKMKIMGSILAIKSPVIQYSIEGNIIREWSSMREAAIFHGITSSAISACCRGVSKKCRGYVWKYKTSKNAAV